MRHLINAAVLMLWSMHLVGCSNALYFAETEKFSLSIEAKAADATEPISGNLGFKERVVVVTPSKNPATVPDHSAGPSTLPSNPTTAAVADNTASYAADADRDALSIAGYFDLQKNNGKRAFDQPVVIRSAFFTGCAARAIAAQGRTGAAITQAVKSTYRADGSSDRIVAWLAKDSAHKTALQQYLHDKNVSITDFIYGDYADLRADAIKTLKIP